MNIPTNTFSRVILNLVCSREDWGQLYQAPVVGREFQSLTQVPTPAAPATQEEQKKFLEDKSRFDEEANVSCPCKRKCLVRKSKKFNSSGSQLMDDPTVASTETKHRRYQLQQEKLYPIQVDVHTCSNVPNDQKP